MSELKEQIYKWVEEQREIINKDPNKNYNHLYNTGKWRILDDLENFLKK